MGAARRKLKFKFQAKVLGPVITVLVVFVGITLWLFSSRIEKQLRGDAEFQRASFQILFQEAVAARTNAIERQLSARMSAADFASIVSLLARANPDFRTIGNTAAPDLRLMLADAGPEGAAAFLVNNTNRLIAGATRQPDWNVKQFHAAADATIRNALETGAFSAGAIALDHRLFDIVAYPCPGEDANPVAVLCVVVEMGDAFARQARPPNSQIAIIVNDQAAASTFSDPALNAELLDTYHQLAGGRARPDPMEPIRGEHFVGVTGSFPRFSGPGSAGYLLLASYEKPLNEFHATQRALLLGSLLGILGGAVAVWLLVRRATRPLRQLRDSAEAVGRGDFSKRIEIASGDELGELAAVFNQMTENLQISQAQLEKTVNMLRNTQAQLIHSEKLSAVGEFVAGVAHELNNPLTALIGYSELLQMGEVDDDSRDSLKRISNSADRCHKIVQSLLSFARQHPPERKLTNIHAVIDAVLEILIYELRTSNISFTKDCAPNMPRLMVDPHQLQQVFLNIVNNARQAIETHQPKGSIRISTRVAGQRAQIRFQDDGPGISAENLARIFNPFFTTKPVGKGTGLGLSVSYGIIQEHGGNIIAESKVGHGTTFIIDLPVTTGTETAAQEPAGASPVPALEGAGKKILIVDDERDILDLVSKVMQRQGYEVQTALDGEKALGCLSRQSFDLIVSDWKMPGMNGRELYERLLETNRGAANRMIFMTGDVLSEKVEKYLSNHGKICLAKPFSLVEFQLALGKAFAKQ